MTPEKTAGDTWTAADLAWIQARIRYDRLGRQARELLWQAVTDLSATARADALIADRKRMRRADRSLPFESVDRGSEPFPG